MPKLSIITINYNNAVGLSKTIESVISQTSKDYEYIVIDGGSADDSVDVIKQYESKIHYWISEPDRGIYHAMNKGILIAAGDYCQFLNSGDWLVSSDVIENMFIRETISSILTGNLLKINQFDIVVKDSGLRNNISFLSFYKGTINHPSAFIKRTLFDTYGFYDESLKIVSDWKFFLQVVGIYGESVEYRDIDISYFDTSGISNQQFILHEEERRQVLNECLPSNILKDYDRYWLDIDRINRLNSILILRKIICLVERVLFKLEKWHLLRGDD